MTILGKGRGQREGSWEQLCVCVWGGCMSEYGQGT